MSHSSDQSALKRLLDKEATMPRSGRLNQVITLRSESLVEDEFGQEQQTFTDFAKVWAGIEKAKSTEDFAEDQKNSEVNVSIIMRYRDDVDIKCQVVHVDRSNVERVYELTGQIPQPQGLGYSMLMFNAKMLHDPSPAIS